MGRSVSTPQDETAKQAISLNLKRLMAQKNVTQLDVIQRTGIAKGSMSGYVNGKNLPSTKNLEKLARFFNVNPEEIDPRFSTSNKEQNVTDNDLDKMLDNARSFDGKPMSSHDREIIRAYLKGLYSGK